MVRYPNTAYACLPPLHATFHRSRTAPNVYPDLVLNRFETGLPLCVCFWACPCLARPYLLRVRLLRYAGAGKNSLSPLAQCREMAVAEAFHKAMAGY